MTEFVSNWFGLQWCSNEFVKDLREIDSKSKAVNASIPFEVIEAIDKGRNPEQCTYQMLYV